jgi:3',5'-cyclic AMP phosphodiesterase CpdA
MLIAQISDLHIGFDPGLDDEPNWLRLVRVLDHLSTGPNRPEALIVSGDLSDRGTEIDYDRIRSALAGLGIPIICTIGNHDGRSAFMAAFPEFSTSGFCQYATNLTEVRLVVLDTHQPGRHGGGFCEARAAWLAATLADEPTRPTVLVMHHPPFAAGISWMDPAVGEPWIERFTRSLAGHRQIKAIWCGHLHRSLTRLWSGIAVSVCPSVSPALTLDLRSIDADKPDGRSMVEEAPPGLALHRWEEGEFTTHFDTCEPRATLARFDVGMQNLVRSLQRERASSP